jgi:hypothetical protein
LEFYKSRIFNFGHFINLLRYCVSLVSSVKLENEEFLKFYFDSFSYLKRKFSPDSLVKCNFFISIYNLALIKDKKYEIDYKINHSNDQINIVFDINESSIRLKEFKFNQTLLRY